MLTNTVFDQVLLLASVISTKVGSMPFDLLRIRSFLDLYFSYLSRDSKVPPFDGAIVVYLSILIFEKGNVLFLILHLDIPITFSLILKFVIKVAKSSMW